MFPFIGIMADEEPRTETSSNGLYNTSSNSGTSNFDMSSSLLGGLSEFTFMVWVYLDLSNPLLPYARFPYREIDGVSTRPIVLDNTTGIYSRISNSNGGITAVSTTEIPVNNEWFHATVTGSVLNGRIRIYKDGVLLNSAVMTYSVKSGSNDNYLDNLTDMNMSQLNMYNRELSEAEVLEHIADDGTNGVGVLGFDAMTPAQQSGLIYCSSMTKDISISGNEFSDKSGTGVTISPQPSLTGEQVYIYTSLAPPISNYPVTSANLNGTNAYVRLADDIINDTEEFTFFGYFKSPGYGTDTLYMENSSANGGSKIDIKTNASTLRVRVRLSSGSNTYFTPVPNLPLPINQWNFVSVTFKKDDKVEFGCNGTYSSDDTVPTLATGDSLGVIGPAIGAFAYLTNDLGELDASIGFVGLSGHTALTQAELESIRGTDINKAKSLASYPQAIQDKLTNFYNAGTWTDSPSATEDQIGSNNGTYVGGVTQINDGLTVDA